MRTIETLTRHHFSAKATKIGGEVIFIAAAMFAFALLCLPYLMLNLRLS